MRFLFCPLAVLLILSCSSSDNSPPTITHVTIREEVEAGDHVLFSVSAHDDDGDRLTYTWVVNGTPFNSGDALSTAEWTAPDTEGTFIVEVHVSDGINEPVTRTKTLTVKKTPREISKADSIVDSTLVVPAGTHRDFKFEIKPDMLSPIVEVDFEVLSGRDVDVIVLDEIAFKNWQAGIQVNAIYYPGRIAADRKSITPLDSGVYFLVVSNEFSIFTSKTVKIKAVLSYSVIE